MSSSELRSVTVVVPTYNRRESLRRCVEGVLACDVSGLDVTVRVADDGSTDGTPEVVAELQQAAKENVRIHLHSQEHAGAGAARNLAVGLSDAPLVVFLDDDCVPQHGWLQALVNTDWQADVGGVGGRIVSPVQSRLVSRYCRYIRFNEFPPDDGPIRFLNTANCAYPRQVLARVGGLDPRLYGGGEAQDLSHRILLLGLRLVYQPDAVVLHYHRETLGTLLASFWTRGYKSTLRRILWDNQAPPTWKRIRREGRAAALQALQIVFLFRDAHRIRAGGVSAGDAWLFALLDWSRQVLQATGKLAMMYHILTGRQSLDGREARSANGMRSPLIHRRSPTEPVRHAGIAAVEDNY